MAPSGRRDWLPLAVGLAALAATIAIAPMLPPPAPPADAYRMPFAPQESRGGAALRVVAPGGAAAGAPEVPPDWRAALGPVLEGLRGRGPGGVAAAEVPDHPARALVGPLYVTARVEAVAPAPEGPAAPA